MVRIYIKKTNRAVGGKYSKETLEEAVANVKAGRYSLKKAAERYGIPKSTLGLKVNGWRGRPSAGNSNGVAGGGRTALSVEDENKLASLIKVMSKWGFGLSRKEILNTVQTYVKQMHVKTPFRNDRPGEDWFLKFAKRHRLSIKKPELIESSRVLQQRDPFIIYDFFDKLEKVLNDKGLHEHPTKVWNADETSFNYDPKNTKVVTGVGEIAQRQTGGSGKKTTTVLACVNANGFKMPPMILHKGKRLWDNMFGANEYPETSYYVSENGWMTEDVFHLWFKGVFLKSCTERPALLIYDGHLSHISPQLVELAIEEDVTILKLPPHTSAMLQPLDVAVFKGVKSSWDALLTDWQRRNLGKQLTKSDFSNLLGKTWNNIREASIISGFRKTGIYPLDKEAISEERFDPEKLRRYKQQNKKLNIAGQENDSVDPKPNIEDNNVTVVTEHNLDTNNSTSVASVSWENILLSAVKPTEKPVDQKKRTRIDVAEVITTAAYLKRLKAAKEAVKSKKKSTKKKQTNKQVSSDEDESEPIVYAESDDSYAPEREEDDLEVPTSVQEPNNDNMVLGRYIILRVKKRAISHCIGILINREEDYIEVKCLKRCTGYIFEFGSEDRTDQFNYDAIVGILQFPKAINGKLQFSEDLTKFKNIL